jgi:hypothetical protein
MQQRDRNAEPCEQAGEFERDIAAADHEHALGQARQVEDLVGGDAEFAAGDRRIEGRIAAGRDQDMAGADELAALGEADLCGPSMTARSSRIATLAPSSPLR